MKKRILCLWAILCLLCGICTPAFAQDGTFDYEADSSGGGIYLKNYRGSGGEIVIPSEYDGKKVTTVGYLGGSKSVTKVTVSEGVTLLIETFKDMTSLKEVVLPHSLQAIGVFTFQNTGLTSLNLPEGLEIIAIDSVNRNAKLKMISIPASAETIHAAAIWGNSALQTISVDAKNLNWTTVANGMLLMRKDSCTVFASASGAVPKVFVVPDAVTCLWSETFVNCPNLEVLVLPKSIDGMDGDVIENCPKFKAIYAKADSFDMPPYAFDDISGQVTVYCNASPNMEPSDNFTVKPYIEGMEKEVLAVPNSTGGGQKGGTSAKKPNTAKSPSEQTAASAPDTTVAEMTTEPLAPTEAETVSVAVTEPTTAVSDLHTKSPKSVGWIVGGTVVGVLLAAGIVLVILKKKGKLPSKKAF